MNKLAFLKRYIDFRLSAFLAIFYTCGVTLHFLKSYLLAYDKGLEIDWGPSLAVYLFDWVLVLVYMQFIALNIKTLIIKKAPLRKIIPLHFFFFLLLGVILQFSSDVVKWIVGDIPSPFTLERIKSFVSFLDLDFLTYFSMVFIIYSYFYFKLSRERKQQKTTLENQLVKAKMRMLTSQIQPHFLFNTINCIISLIDTNPRKAQDTLVDLSDFFRAITRHSNSHFIRIADELQILSYYLNILKVRFQENLQIVEAIDPELGEECIPAITLQPLIENSVNHGYSYAQEELEIKISIYTEGGYIHLLVENNGAPVSEEALARKKGIGLTNTEARLRNLYNGDFSFTIRNKPDGTGVENRIRIPIIKMPLEEAELEPQF